MRAPALGSLLSLLVASQAVAGDAALIARGRAVEAIVSPSGKVLPTPAPGKRLTDERPEKSSDCPSQEPMPASAARDLIEKIAQDEKFYPEFVLAVARAESQFQTTATSPRGAIGLMQLEPEIARHYGVNICDPADNVRGGVRFLRDLHGRYRNPLFILAAYNAGEQALLEHGGVPPFPETVNFVAAVVNDFYEWPKISGNPRHGRDASTPAALEDRVKNSNWRSGFVWNVEQNGERE